ncbi:hypothetical protein [Natranaerofaba carboxydovora]|uniref:hypothetical protein n=1 Tax=Natranaerofaba carboxydovora TaxID=2742683 RepID=UPI001F144B2A|nr:hypothetical protein [Natranaerofaba carboxydovora]UMZ74154.1 hypothetical protein ACONDI_01734 [Natranaerofaba carboxydovora]
MVFKKQLNETSIEKAKTNLWIKDYYVVIFVALILLTSYIAIYLVDIHNFLGIRDRMHAHDGLSVPFLWDYLFTEGGPIEIFQWLFIGLFMMTSAYIAGILNERKENKAAIFWLLLAIAGVFMIMEDAGNVRHFLTTRFVLLFKDGMIYRSITELAYFSLMALIPLIALIKYWRYPFSNRRTALFLLAGYFFYGIAVGMSGTRDIMFWYQTAGNVLYNLSISLGGGEELLMLYEEVDQYLADIGSIEVRYRMMDYLVEESFELLGASFLWTSSISYLEYIKKDSN